MRIEHLQLLITVANSKSINIASNQLHMTHQNISKTLKQVESELGTKLFIRNAQGVSLTPEGQRIYLHAKNILNEYDLMLCKNYPVTTYNLKGFLNILAPPGFSTLIFNMILYLRTICPGLNIYTNDQEAAHINHGLLQPTKIAEIIYTSFGKESFYKYYLDKLKNNYIIYYLGESSLKVMGHKNSILPSYQNISFSNLESLSLPLVLLQTSHEIKPLWLQLLHENGCYPSDVFFVNSEKLNGACLSHNSAYTISTNFYSHNAPLAERQDFLHSVPLRNNIAVCHVMLVPITTHLSPQAQLYQKIFKELHENGYQLL